MEAPKMLSETQFNEILTLIPNTRDRANLVVHHVLTQHKIRELQEEKAAAVQRIHELESAMDSIHDDLRRAGDQIADQASIIESLSQTRQIERETQPSQVSEEDTKRTAFELKAKIVHWLRTGPGAGETVRAKFAFKLAGMIESDSYAASDYVAY